MDISNLLAVSEVLKEMKPEVEEMISQVYQYGPMLRKVLDDLVSEAVRIRINMIMQFMDAGFSRSDAILMSCDIQAQLMKCLKQRS